MLTVLSPFSFGSQSSLTVHVSRYNSLNIIVRMWTEGRLIVRPIQKKKLEKKLVVSSPSACTRWWQTLCRILKPVFCFTAAAVVIWNWWWCAALINQTLGCTQQRYNGMKWLQNSCTKFSRFNNSLCLYSSTVTYAISQTNFVTIKCAPFHQYSSPVAPGSSSVIHRHEIDKRLKVNSISFRMFCQ